MTKHKHRPCPCGCGEPADECMRPGSALNAFSISEPEADAPNRAGGTAMTDRDTAAALAKALPADVRFRGKERWRTGDGHEYSTAVGFTAEQVAAIQGANLAEAGWVLVRPDDEATVERVARAIHIDHCVLRPKCTEPTVWSLSEARIALAALAARPGTADTAHTEVEA